MSASGKIEVGKINWIDLTIENAEQVRDFYEAVVGWKAEPVSMGDYNDFNMTLPSDGKPAAGVCHARGVNKDLPVQWLIYINVEDIETSIKNCERLGGKIISAKKNMSGYGRYCVIQDPAGAVVALFEPEK